MRRVSRVHIASRMEEDLHLGIFTSCDLKFKERGTALLSWNSTALKFDLKPL